jgi:anti-sigma B factor antagonist
MTDLAGRPRAWRIPGQAHDPSPFACAHYDPEGVVVAVSGELDLASSPELRRRVMQLLSLPVRAITLDLAAVTFMDSSGLAALITARDEARQRHIDFRLASVPAQARMVMELTDTADVLGVVSGDGAD